MQTLLEVLQKTTAFFTKREIENARLNAEQIFAHVLECKRLDLYLRFEQPMSDADLDLLRPLVKRRGQREPLQYILGTVDFWDITLAVDARALIPRPETEELVELLVERHASAQSVLDLGTGSGAIAVSLARGLPEASVVAVDQSEEALALAATNAQRNGVSGRVQFLHSDWFQEIPAQQFDLIVSNPPYLTEAEWEEAATEVKDCEPRTALVAEDEGTADLRTIMEQARAYLRPGAFLAMETGIAQHSRLKEWATELRYSQFESRQDLNGRERFVFLAQ